MKAPLLIIGLLIVSVTLGCAEKASAEKAREDSAAKARDDAAAKARADAARKEMETLPKVFSTPDYLKKNQPVQAPTSTAPAKKDTGAK